MHRWMGDTMKRYTKTMKINDKLDKIIETCSLHGERLAKIEQHLSDLNGGMKSNKIKIHALYGVIGTLFTAMVILIIQYLLNRGLT